MSRDATPQDVIEGRARWCVVCADNAEVLPKLPAVDAVVTDPPYGINDAPILGQDRTGKRTGKSNTWHDESKWDAEVPVDAAMMVSRFELVAWFGHWRKRESVERAIALPLRCEIVWAKDTHVGPPCPVAMRDERIWVFAQNGIKPRTFETSVWDSPIIPTWARKEHKNEKPTKLMKRLVAFLTDEDAVVLDPFCGSGTTGVACLRLGRRFIGIEKEAHHAAIARDRLDAESRGLTLRDVRHGQRGLFEAGV